MKKEIVRIKLNKIIPNTNQPRLDFYDDSIKGLAESLNRETPVIALTANAVSGAREMFLQEGFDGFIAKPINMADFERVVQRVLGSSRKGRGGERK